MIEMVWIVCE